MTVDFLTQKTSLSSPKPALKEAFGQKSQVFSSAEKLAVQSNSGESLKFSARDMGKIPAFKGFEGLWNKALILSKVSTLEAFAKKYDGAQKGIKVFDGLDILQTFIATSNIYSFPLMRGCRNACGHCARDAKPPIKNTATHISSLLWEDFVDLVSGIVEFKKLIGEAFPISGSENKYISPFWDSDPAATKIPDLKGGFHGIAEAVELMHQKLPKPIMIDTAGWPIQDAWSQTQGDELAKVVKDNPKAFYRQMVHVSLNPFSPLLEKSCAMENEGNFKGAKKMEDKYIDRMANVFLTFLECGADVSIRSSNEAKSELDMLNSEIFWKVSEKAHKMHLNPVQRENLSSLQNKLCCGEFSGIIPIGRAKKFFDSMHIEEVKANYLDYYEDVRQNPNWMFNSKKLFDINGRVYAANDFEQIDTGIQLNFRNKDKKTAPFNNYIHQK